MEEKIAELLPKGYQTIDNFLNKAYAVDIADFIERVDDEYKEEILKKIEDDKYLLAEVISHLDYETQYFVSRLIPRILLTEILSYMYSDDAADFLGAMPVGKVKGILNLMKEKKAEELHRLLGYDEESAGGLMTTEYLAFYEDQTADKVLNKIRQIAPNAEMIYYIYVISRKKELLGVLSVRQLLAAKLDAKLSELMTDKVIKVGIDLDQEKVAYIFAKYDLLALPVINKRNQLMGIITVDDAIDVIEEEATEDMYKLAGTTDIHTRTIFDTVKKRLPWLLILLLGNLLSGSVIHGFEQALQSVVALAVFIPVLMDMGGNIGTQCLTVVVRGLATAELKFSNFKGHLWKEVKAGFIMALTLGILISGIAFFWQGNPMLGAIVGVSLFLTLMAAVAAGTSIPFVIDALGADPAVAAGPFITTLIDIFGLFIYFSLSTMLMEKLI